MGSDYERRSHDESKRYRGVIHQQGRVSLAADTNEAREIAADEDRRNLLDAVGTYGTPSGAILGAAGEGYRLSKTGLDVSVAAGTMFVGGVRVELPTTITYHAQPEWRDKPVDALPTTGSSLFYLWLCEHEVCALEDSALREVALGGPDTATRARISQRVKRLSGVIDCDTSLQKLSDQAQLEGQTLDAGTMELRSKARLSVAYQPTTESTSCDPVAVQGYLGADNQNIRFRVVAPDTLYWAFDNASTFYSAKVIDAQTIEIEQTPLDDERAPKSTNFVEVFPLGVTLSGSVSAASLDGEARAVSNYLVPQRRIELASSLSFAINTKVFVRIYHGKITIPVVSADVGTTGLQVTVATEPTGGAFTPGDHWMVALRPTMPTEVFPARFVTPQPPDGPRRWAAPLGIIDHGPLNASKDCRPPFDNLVELTDRVNKLRDRVDVIEGDIIWIKNQITLIWNEIRELKLRGGGCCTLTLTPELVAELGRELSGMITEALEASAGHGLVVCLKGGGKRGEQKDERGAVFELHEPIVLRGARHVTIRACDGAVRLKASARAKEGAFRHGMIEVTSSSNVAVEGIELECPLERFDRQAMLAGIPFGEVWAERGATDTLWTSVGVRAVNTKGLSVRDCTFNLIHPSSKPATFTVEAGVLLSGVADQICIERCLFVGPSKAKKDSHWVFGIAHTPVTTLESKASVRGAAARVLPAGFRRATLRDNRFDRLDAAVFVLAQFGEVRASGNVVRRSRNGLLFVSTLAEAFVGVLGELRKTALRGLLSTLERAVFIDHGFAEARSVLRAFPLPQGAVREEDFWRSADPQEPRGELVREHFEHEMVERFEAWAVEAAPDPKLAEVRAPSPRSEVFRALDETIGRFERQAAWRGIGLVEEKQDPREAPSVAEQLKRLALQATARFYVEGNDVDVAAEDGTGSGAALVLLDAPVLASESAVVSGNHLRSSDPVSPTAVVLMFQRSAITGNIVVNEASRVALPLELAKEAKAAGEDATEVSRKAEAAAKEHASLVAQAAALRAKLKEDANKPDSESRRTMLAALQEIEEMLEAEERLAEVEAKKRNPISLLAFVPRMNQRAIGASVSATLGTRLLRTAEQLTVTGNVFQGTAVIPVRWNPMNAES